METLELSVFIIVAIIAGGALVYAIITVDFGTLFKSYAGYFKDREPQEYKIGASELPQEIAKRWKECRLGLDEMESSVYVKDQINISREDIVLGLLRGQHCEEIDCRNRTGKLFIADSISAPKVIYIKCYNESLIIG